MLSADIAPLTLVFTVFASFCVYFVFTTFIDSPRTKSSPPLAHGSRISQTFGFMRDAQKFCFKTREKYGPLVSIKIGVENFHLLSDYVSGFKEIIKSEDRFDPNFIFNRFEKILWEMPEEMILSKEKKMLNAVSSKTLRSLPVIHELSQNYRNSLLYEFHKLQDSSSPSGKLPSFETGFFNFYRKLLFLSSVRSFFGPDFPADYIYQPFRTFELNIPYIVRGYPKFTLGDSYKGKDKVVSVIENFLNNKDQNGVTYDHDATVNMSTFIKNHVDIIKADNQKQLVKDCGAKFIFGLLFASTSNIVNTAFWITTKVFEDKNVLAKVISIAEEAYDEDLENFNWDSLLSNPYLISITKETLRLYSNLVIVRNVQTNTTVTIEKDKPFSLRKSDVIIAPLALIHQNEKVYPDPLRWKSNRFVNHAEMGENIKIDHTAESETRTEKETPEEATQRKLLDQAQAEDWKVYNVWGGGSHMCPGRFFAKNEMIIQLIYAVWYLKVEFKESVPEGHVKERFGAGPLQPLKDFKAQVTLKREVK